MILCICLIFVILRSFFINLPFSVVFTLFLAYKLKEKEKYLVKVDRSFPSSKTCSECGTKKDDLSLSEKTYICNFGNIMGRDINAAINIKNEGMGIV